MLWMQQTNSHGLRSPVEKKGWHGHSPRDRVPRSLPGQTFIAFQEHTSKKALIHYAQVCLGDYFLQITKERMLLIYFLQANKEKMLQMQGNDKSDWSGYTPSLGELAQTLGSYFKDMQ